MTTTMNISLPVEMKSFVDEQIAKGGYSSVSEYMRDLLRDAQKKAARERLETLLLEGIDSGESTPMTEEDWADIRRQGLARLAARQKKS